MAEPSPSRLFTLPAELRRDIFIYMILNHFRSRRLGLQNETSHRNYSILPLIRKRSQLYPIFFKADPRYREECLPILYSKFPAYFATLRIVRQIPPKERMLITETALMVNNVEGEPRQWVPYRWQNDPVKRWIEPVTDVLRKLRRLLPQLRKLSIHLQLNHENAGHTMSSHEFLQNSSQCFDLLTNVEVTIRFGDGGIRSNQEILDRVKGKMSQNIKILDTPCNWAVEWI